MSELQLQPIDVRMIRARKFASQIMAIIGDVVSDKDGAVSRLIVAAYRSDVQITSVSQVNGAVGNVGQSSTVHRETEA